MVANLFLLNDGGKGINVMAAPIKPPIPKAVTAPPKLPAPL